MAQHLGIVFTNIGENTLEATMPVDSRTKQPFGLLHGGASVALAETLGSTAATLFLENDKAQCVGLEINANHIRSLTSGTVTGIAEPIHVGKSTQVWQIRITDEQSRLVCISRLTLAIIRVQES